MVEIEIKQFSIMVFEKKKTLFFFTEKYDKDYIFE